MEKGKMNIAVLSARLIAVLLGIVLVVWGLTVHNGRSYHEGNYAAMALGGLLILGAFFEGALKRLLPRWCKIVLCCAFSLFALMLFALGLYGVYETATYDEDAAIVLGAGLIGERPGTVLQKRLDVAVEYAVKNPKALIIVSGGQGADEAIRESEAMYRYLVSKGVAKERIVQEGESVNTWQNVLNSKAILDQRFTDGYRVCIITTDYHALRSAIVAKRIGVEATRVNSGLYLHQYPTNVLREAMAVAHMLVFGSRQ